VIKDPFGYSTGPQYMGATSPIVGGTISNLSLTRDKLLQAEVMVEDLTGSDDFSIRKSLFVWDAAALIEAAVQHADKGKKLSLAIDRGEPDKKPYGEPIPELVPVRFDSPEGGDDFRWMYGISNYYELGELIEIEKTDITYPVTPPPPPPADTKEKMGLLDTILIRSGAQASFMVNETLGGLKGVLGMDTTQEQRAMKEAQEALEDVKFDGDGIVASLGSKATQMMETLGVAAFGTPIAKIQAFMRIVALGKAVVDSVMAELGKPSSFELSSSDIKVKVPDLPGLEGLA